MKGYKYVDYNDAHHLAEGSVRIGTLAGYSALENSRRDAFDGCIIRTTKKDIIDTSLSADRKLAADVGLDIAPDVQVMFDGINLITSIEPMFCLCMSKRPDNHHLCSDRPQAIFEVEDCGILADEILRSQRRIMGECWTGPVIYESRKISLREIPTWGADAFVKDIEFTPEEEIRSVFRPRCSGIVPFNAPANERIARLLKRVG